MTRHNKKYYQSEIKVKKTITLTGNVYLQYHDDEAIAAPQLGDLGVYARCDALHDKYLGEYERTGLTGYFKVDVWDGKKFCFVILDDIFAGNEHHFAKTERPIDTYHLCAEILRTLKGKQLERTYREHYELVIED